MGSEGSLLLVEDGTDVESERPGSGYRAKPIGEKEAAGDVKETLGGVERSQFGEAFGRS